MLFSKQKKKIPTEKTFENIKKEIAEMYVKNYISFQFSLLDTYNCNSFLDTYDPDTTVFLSKLCFEYSVLLFEITFLRFTEHIVDSNLKSLVDHLFCAHLSCTSEAYEAYTCAAEKHYSDEGIFNGISFYYSNVLLNNISPIDLFPSVEKPKLSNNTLQKLFAIFCNHSLVFLLNDIVAIQSNTVLPQIDSFEQSQTMESFIPICEFIKEYDQDLTLFFSLHKN